MQEVQAVQVILTDHFKRRYKERVGHLSEQSAKKKIGEKLQGFPCEIVEAKFALGEYFVVVGRSLKKPDVWVAVTISPGKPKKKQLPPGWRLQPRGVINLDGDELDPELREALEAFDFDD